MSNSRIRRLFFNELKTGFKKADGKLEWPIDQYGVVISDAAGKIIKPNTTHVEVHLIPAPAESETLQGDHVRYMGIYQIDVKVLLEMDDLYGDANLVLDEIADKIQSIFKINMRLTEDDIFFVQVMSPMKVTEARRIDKSNWWHAHCYFNYRADTSI